MVRGAEGPGAGERPLGDQAGHRMDHRCVQQFPGRERRQEAGQTLGHHRLAGSRRAHEQQVVAARRGDLQGALGVLLALHVSQVRRGFAFQQGPGRRRGHDLQAAEVVEQGDDRLGGQDRCVPGPGGFRPTGLRTDEAQPHGAGRHRRRQGAGHGGNPRVEGQLAHHRPAVEGVRRDDAHDHQDGKGDGQVVVTALLGHVGRGEIDHHPLRRKGKPHAHEGGAHPLAALGHGLVAEADNGDPGFGGIARRDLGLDLDPARFNPLKSHCDDARGHAPISPIAGLIHNCSMNRKPGSRTKIEL